MKFGKMAGSQIALLLIQSVLYVQSSLIQINSDHIYQRLTVEVTDQVPRHLCQDTLIHLEVSSF